MLLCRLFVPTHLVLDYIYMAKLSCVWLMLDQISIVTLNFILGFPAGNDFVVGEEKRKGGLSRNKIPNVVFSTFCGDKILNPANKNKIRFWGIVWRGNLCQQPDQHTYSFHSLKFVDFLDFAWHIGFREGSNRANQKKDLVLACIEKIGEARRGRSWFCFCHGDGK